MACNIPSPLRQVFSGMERFSIECVKPNCREIFNHLLSVVLQSQSKRKLSSKLQRKPLYYWRSLGVFALDDGLIAWTHQSDFECKGLRTVLPASGLVTLQATAAILITHKTTLPLLVPLSLSSKYDHLFVYRVGFRRLVRLEDKVILKKSFHHVAKWTAKFWRLVCPNLCSSRFRTSRLVRLRRFARFLVWSGYYYWVPV